MGWYYGGTRKDVIAEVTQDTEQVKTLRKFASGNTLWTVQETKDGQRFIGCYLLQRGGGEWGYKPMEESMGPCEVTCPLAFLEMVPDPGGYATEWRKRVRAYHERIRLPKMGQEVKLTNGNQLKITSVRPLRGVDTKSGMLYRIPRRMLNGVVETPVSA